MAYLELYDRWRKREDFNLGGVQIREKTAQENFDFSVEEIQARYMDFLAPLHPGTSEDETPQIPDPDDIENPRNKEPEQNGSGSGGAEKTEGFDEFISKTIQGSREKNGTHANSEVNDNISAEFNDSNFWKEANLPRQSSDLDKLLQELNS